MGWLEKEEKSGTVLCLWSLWIKVLKVYCGEKGGEGNILKDCQWVQKMVIFEASLHLVSHCLVLKQGLNEASERVGQLQDHQDGAGVGLGCRERHEGPSWSHIPQGT